MTEAELMKWALPDCRQCSGTGVTGFTMTRQATTPEPCICTRRLRPAATASEAFREGVPHVQLLQQSISEHVDPHPSESFKPLGFFSGVKHG
jgi:hypothetical protein